MVATRSSTKRKSPDDTPVKPQALGASTPKRRRLPVRRKGKGAAAAAEIPETDEEGESEAGADEADETLDLDAALQAQVAAQSPDTPLTPAAGTRFAAAPKAGAEVAAQEEEEEEDSDDEAPEAVSNVQAASKAREAAESMMKAAREYVCPEVPLYNGSMAGGELD